MKSHSNPNMAGIPESAPVQQQNTDSVRSLSHDDMVALSPSVADQVAVGTEKILTSAHVSEGPGRVASAPVPSVFHDDRGEIHRLRVGGKRVNLTHSKAKVMRSGYIHPFAFHHFVVSGKVEVWMLTDSGTEKVIHEKYSYFTVPAYTPHLLFFLADTVLLEYWPEDHAFRCWYYHPYRHVMDVQNSIVCTSTGHLLRLVPQDHSVIAEDVELKNLISKMMWLTAGVAMGVTAGLFLGRSRN